MTGEQLPCDIFCGPTYYQRLKHMVYDKLHSRATGPRVMLTRQPAEGRARDGGLRFGEMERDCILAHGASWFLKERMHNVSDGFELPIAKSSGLPAAINKDKNICKTFNENSNEYFDVSIPYSFKLLMQELMSMAVCVRLNA